MEEDLVNDALTFWTNKDVLYQRSPGSYAVLERLDMKPVDTGDQQQPPQQVDAGISAVKSQDAVLKENAIMFETFIANMLRNQGPKLVDGQMGITALLKMVLPAFTYGEDEVRWLLGEMEARGEVVRKGDSWAVAG
jgi:anaphase-promoting complex subunit 2